jgi:hypothetical protein
VVCSVDGKKAQLDERIITPSMLPMVEIYFGRIVNILEPPKSNRTVMISTWLRKTGTIPRLKTTTVVKQDYSAPL